MCGERWFELGLHLKMSAGRPILSPSGAPQAPAVTLILVKLPIHDSFAFRSTHCQHQTCCKLNIYTISNFKVTSGHLSMVSGVEGIREIVYVGVQGSFLWKGWQGGGGGYHVDVGAQPDTPEVLAFLQLPGHPKVADLGHVLAEKYVLRLQVQVGDGFWSGCVQCLQKNAGSANKHPIHGR